MVSTAVAASIGINFSGTDNKVLASGDTAGLASDAQAYWNNLTNLTNYTNTSTNTGSLATLVDSSGTTVAGASMTVGATPTTGVKPRAGNSWGFSDLNEKTMRQGGAYPQPQITITGIPYDCYDVYVITECGAGGPMGGGVGSASISVANNAGGAVDPTTYYYRFAGLSGAYVKATATSQTEASASTGSNYVLFTNNSASDITIDVDGTLEGALTGVAAVQIVERQQPFQSVNMWRYPTETELDQVKAAGFTHVRIGEFWESLEKNVITDAQGYRISSTFKWNGNNDGWGIDPLIGRITQRGLKVIFPLCYDHDSYPSVTTEAGRVAFANYAAECAAHFSDKDIIWEVWNEPHGKGFSDPDAYMALVEETVDAMRAADPNCTIISGGVVNPGWSVITTWMDRCFELGLQDLVDGIGIHNYDSSSEAEWPERLVASIDYLRDLLAGYGATDVPFYQTEWGSNIDTDYPSGYSTAKRESLQADAAVRSNLLCDMLDVHAGNWYEWHPSGSNTGFSIALSGGGLRPSNDALTQMAVEMDGFTFRGRFSLTSPDDYALIYTRGPECKLVVWTYEADTDHTVSIPVSSPAQSFNARDRDGDPLTLLNIDGYIRPTLTTSPLYIDITGATNGDGIDVLNQISPSSLIGEDIGAVGITGTDSLSNGVYTIEATGADIWGSSDKFRFLHQSMTGNGVITAHISSLENVNYWTKAGLMMRASTSANAVNAFLMTTPTDTTRFQYRLTSAGSTSSSGSTSGDAPLWLRLERIGNLFISHKSTDGVSWTKISEQSIPNMPQTIEVGLAITSHDNSQLATATFDNVSLFSSGIDPYLNRAVNKTATASSSRSGNTADKAVDASLTTRWESSWADNQWLSIDLGEEHNVTGVHLTWETAYASVYRLEVSNNGSSWTTLTTVPDGQGGEEYVLGLDGDGRYFRIFCEDRATTWGSSLWEIEVFGTPTSP